MNAARLTWSVLLSALATGCGLDAQLLDRPGKADAGPAPDGGGGSAGSPSVSGLGAGEYHTCAAREGAAWCWGANGSGQAVPASESPLLAPGR
ncbi:MAG TPA: RCC1 domain-containing protein, partial [Polyangiaceae bacterium]|nr:RCC1 domain-containing protein [Polyangiaceae bacterium]